MARNVKEKISMKFNISQLERIIIALINNGYNKKFASNVKRLFDMFNPDFYKNEYEKEVRVYLVKQIAEIILVNNIDQKESILSFLDTDGKYYNDCTEILNNLFEEELPENELFLLDKNVSNQLKYSTIMEKSETLSDMLLNLKTENFDNLENAIEKLEDNIDAVNRDIKSARESLEDSKKDLSLSSSSFINTVGKLINKERNPSSKVKTGQQYLNTLFNGGMEKGRLYTVLAPSKGFKSGFMLNVALAAKKYNTFETHDPKLKPVIVYLTMENTTEETLTRIWAYCFGDDSNISNYSAVEAANMLEKAGIYTPNDPNSAELVIWYRANRSISTADLNIMLDDLKKEGKECVLLVLDYIRRIRPAEPNKELRLELSNVANELKTMAMEQDIPILTGSQINRTGIAALDDAESFEEKLRAFEKVGMSSVSESLDIIMNTDYAFTINRLEKKQFNEAGEVEYSDRYLAVKLIACRAKQPSIISFKHRFADGNGMKLIEDINLPRPVSTLTDTDLIKDRMANNQNTKAGGGRKIVG
jgi:hypothetical protein